MDLDAAAGPVDIPRLVTSVTRTFTFEASHQLEWHAGKCANLHGHSYELVVTVTRPVDENGVVIDFADLKATVTDHVLSYYDHTHLNTILPNPTAELIAADAISRLLTAGLAVSQLTVRETSNCSATVRVEHA